MNRFKNIQVVKYIVSEKTNHGNWNTLKNKDSEIQIYWLNIDESNYPIIFTNIRFSKIFTQTLTRNFTKLELANLKKRSTRWLSSLEIRVIEIILACKESALVVGLQYSYLMSLKLNYDFKFLDVFASANAIFFTFKYFIFAS